MIFSIGHSTHSPDEFAVLARGIDVIVDVRSHPTSRWEWWRLEEMKQWLPGMGIEVVWQPSLGGWTKRHWQNEALRDRMKSRGVYLAAYAQGAFPKQRIGKDRDEAREPDYPQWINQGLYDYSWFTALPEFHMAAGELIREYGGNDKPRAAIMCCEALWWKCHRSMIADYLLAVHHHDVLHIKSRAPKRPTTSRWDSHAAKLSNRLERYPAEVRATWKAQQLLPQGT